MLAAAGDEERAPGRLSVAERAVVLLWITLGTMAPRRWAERLLELRFDVKSRPKLLEPVLSRLAS